MLRDCARCLSTACSRVVDRRFNAADESCSDPASAVYFDCVARYYFLATFEARGGVRSTPGCAPTVSRGGSPGRGFATYKNSQQRAKARAFRHEDPK